MRKYGLKKDLYDPQDFPFKSNRGLSFIAHEVDLRPLDAVPIFDQGYLGSCTANAICAFKSYLDKNYGSATREMFFHYSRLYLYWHERNLMGTVDYDSGAYLRDGMKVLQKIGCAAEPLYPYIADDFRNTPSADAEENAGLHKITEYTRLNSLDPLQLRESLSNGYPVVLGVQLYESFESSEVTRTGIVPMPNRDIESVLGGHALLAMGYKWIGDKEYIICRNSWGADWGDNGYCYIPIAFMGRYIIDAWTAKV